MKRYLLAILVILVLVSGFAFAKKPLAVVRSQKTIDKPVNYPSYTADFEFFVKWLEAFAEFDIITDEDVESGVLKNYEAILLPDNAVMGADEVDCYFDFIDRGGRLFACSSTSLRKEDGTLTSYQIADIIGVTWVQWTNAKDKHNYMEFGDHKIFDGLDVEGIKSITPSTQIVTLNLGEPLATWYNEDKVTPSEADEKNACIIENEGSIFVTFSINNSIYLSHPVFGKIMKNVVAYLAPSAIK
ncbi:MAG: hypothetical protein PHD88_03195 [Firmicutes bacterium]|nr:hypothetical protein [Bacillota bacterium]MDD4263516.1 hypothetical protein [Bacillota bacterium]MDD4693396.1 hypothetical protein [Bacillota bacterium]